ncbi:hypothetical protein EV190_12653 [Actinorugispora endophytica]|uniref:Uncharacterized protein n=1 Tax=Actinorugispora endophytica TaxID=1605990 RepID=A0A4R6UJ73_9ACTN|nr:hypothetical protein EV190_12653 [Actinorugispora endophytica]
MSVQTVRFRATHERVLAVAKQTGSLFDAVRAAAPQATRYTAPRAADEPESTLIPEPADGAGDPLPSIPAAAAFRSRPADQTGGEPEPRPCTVSGGCSA